MSDIKLTMEERLAIRALKRISRNWPKSLWLFSANGTLHVMKCKPDGSRAVTAMDCDVMDPGYSVDTVNIPNDGGDW